MRTLIRFALMISLLAPHITFSQLLTPPPLDWQAGFGGTGADLATTIVPAATGGFLIAGYSDSNTSGNKTAPAYGGFDFWIVRLDGSGDALWDRSYGGATNDMLQAVVATADGGFVLGGSSLSGVTGTKTSTNFGGADYWLVRIDATGDVLWERSFGGTNSDTLWSIDATSDGGFILGGTSDSGPSGNKTSVSYGRDFWIVRLDATGEKLWDRTYGAGAEFLHVVRQAPDGGFFVGGTSASGIGGNKASTNHTVGQSSLADDFWVLRLDADGGKLWERQLGGRERDALRDLTLLPDGGILVGGHTFSFPSGTKTAPLRGDARDYWIVHLDANGVQIWDQSYGGSASDRLRRAALLPDGGLILYGHADSTLGGTKTSIGFGFLDYWLVRIDGSGNQVWDQSLGGSAADGDGLVPDPEGNIVVTTHGMVVGGSSRSGADGIKTVRNFGSHDYWIVALNTNIQPALVTSVPRLELTSAQCARGSNTFQIWNSGTGTVFYDVSTDVPWATVSATNGVSDGNTNVHVVTYAHSGPVGSYSGTVSFIHRMSGTTLATLPLDLTLTKAAPPSLRITRSFPGGSRLLLGPANCPVITEFSVNFREWTSFRTNQPAAVEREVAQPLPNNWSRFYRARIP